MILIPIICVVINLVMYFNDPNPINLSAGSFFFSFLGHIVQT